MDKSENVWVIEPRLPGLRPRLEEIWKYRHFLRYFQSRAMKKMYRRTVLGKFWIFFRPFMAIVVGTLIFGNVIGIKTGEIPYFLFYMGGMTIWSLFTSSAIWATRSIEMNRSMLRKMYFPRLILPIANITPAVVIFLISLGIMFGTIVYYIFKDGKVYLNLGMPLLIAIIAVALTIIFAVAIGLWTSVPGAQARDIRFSLAYVFDFLFLLTPVIYPVSFIPQSWRWLILLNPMAALVETFKWGLLGIGQLKVAPLIISVIVVLITLISGIWFFTRAEARSIDRI